MRLRRRNTRRNCWTLLQGKTFLSEGSLKTSGSLDFRLEAIEQSLRDNAEESEKRAATSETLVDTLSSLKDEMSEKFGSVTSKVDNLADTSKVLLVSFLVVWHLSSLKIVTFYLYSPS